MSGIYNGPDGQKLHGDGKLVRELQSESPGSAVGGDFYNGIEWLACWLLDNAEGETITEEQLRPWAAKAWAEHLKRQNTERTAVRWSDWLCQKIANL